MRATGTGESHVARPLSREAYLTECDPDFVVDFLCNVFDMPVPKLKATHGKASTFHGTYQIDRRTITYTKPYTGVILHELAHHFTHMRGLNGTGHHSQQFADILQELIDLWV
ncbi:MAG: hypothetical protein M0R06_00265 [Sphaerochaeta sp.]|jgi:hypothetical protein|nr:hypothetical protein [Sphaerochaeta sp.]